MSKILQKVKKYWNKQPCNINHSNKAEFTEKYFKEVRKKKYFVEKHILNFANFKKYNKKNVLEIGCGIGTDAIEFIKNGAKYIGVDYSERSVQIAKKRVEVLKLSKKKPRFFVDNCEKLTKIKRLKIEFNLIYSFGVIHHTENMKQAFKRIYEIANKKTEIKIMLYAENSYKKFLLNDTMYRYESQKNCPVVHTVNDEDVNNLIKNKFKIIKKYQDFIFPYKIIPYKNNKFIKINHFNVMPKKIFNLLQKNIGEHMMLTLKKI
jgi:cyclopropane fatty-acyl-phospholipid synthase-like methyltransferase